MERYVIPHSVTEAAGSRGTSRKSNSCGAWLQLWRCVLDVNVAVRKSEGKRFAPLEHLF